MIPYILSLCILSSNPEATINNTPSGKIEYVQLNDEITEMYNYDINGILYEKGYFLNNKPTGKWITYFENGNTRSIAYYMNGSKEGKWKVFDSNNKILYEIQYKNNIKQVAKSFNSEGELTAYSLH